MPNTTCGDAYQIIQPQETIESEGWWKFKADGTTMYVTLTNTSASRSNLVFSIYNDGPCESLGAPLLNSQPDMDLSVSLSGLTDGNDYLLKIANSSGSDIEGFVATNSQGPIKGGKLFVRIPA